MEIIIHRGTNQIGGCITEIKTNKARVIVDFGSNLPNDDLPEKNEIQIEGVTRGTPSCDAIFFTHYHADHIGMYARVLPEISMYMGQAAKAIFLRYLNRIRLGDHINKDEIEAAEKIKTYKENQPILIGDITVTPYRVSHSAYDSYMFLIEADGKRILHTGDFRNHGFMGESLIETLRKYIKKVDVSIVEGTLLSRDYENVVSETQIIDKISEFIKKNKYVYILCASTNIDRIAAAYAATPKGKYFLCDEYQREILSVAGEDSKNDPKYKNLYRFEKVLAYGDNLYDKIASKGFCMIIRANSDFKKIMEKFDKKDSVILYSMWEGYLKEDQFGHKEFLEGYHWEKLHSSGHATKEAIEELCKITEPDFIIPIHTVSPEKFSILDLKGEVLYLEDGEKFSL